MVISRVSPAPPASPSAPKSAALLLVIGGAVCLSCSALFVKLAEVNAGTAAFLRCAIALLALIPLAVRERRRHGPLDGGLWWSGIAAGLFLGTDYAMWMQSILDVGAGIATVLNNVQVIVFPVLGLVFSAAPISRRFLLVCPIMLTGIALTGGVFADHGPGGDQLRGALLGVASGAAYAGYLYLNRRSGQRSPRHVVTPVCLATAAAAVVTGIAGTLSTGVSVDLPATSWAWLIALALLGQVLAWVVLAAGTPRLAPNTSATLLLLQPVLALVLGALVLGEAPAITQLAGCAIVIVSVWFANLA